VRALAHEQHGHSIHVHAAQLIIAQFRVGQRRNKIIRRRKVGGVVDTELFLVD
jgi:hypothetical protein